MKFRANAILNRTWFATFCFALALVFSGKAFWIELKAELAQILIAQAWSDTLETGEPQKPWPWADTSPVAKLTFADGDSYYVLDGTSGEALAFGPGMMDASALYKNVAGTNAIAGHRDSHFEFLQNIEPEEEFWLQSLSGEVIKYQTAKTEIIDSDNQELNFQYQFEELKLISCYPFDALANRGSLRYVLTAFPSPPSDA